MTQVNLSKSDEFKAELFGSFLLFCRTFFPLVTGRDFIISDPPGRESHFITISKELTKCARLQTNSLLINVPPGHGKSVLCSMWVAWCFARYPDSQFLYISYGHELAAKHTAFIKRIIETHAYQVLFDIKICSDSKAKDFFQVESKWSTGRGSCRAFGSSSAVTGQDAGLPGVDRFSGALVLDDLTKPDEANSATIRENILKNYQETILQRPRSPKVPVICIAQRLHEADICAHMLSGNDERDWRSVVLPSIDSAGNALYPEVNPIKDLRVKQDKSPYVFASQYQQNPIPAGGALFRREDFVILEDEPDILMTFITADTAETSKSYNDASVFSFWGLYNLDDGVGFALHWLNCWEIRVEPKDLEYEFKSFHADCMLHRVKPRLAAIEKKSTGVTLLSMLKGTRGLELREVKRTKASGSKTQRFLEMQPIIASKLISFTEGANHAEMCIQHMMKITANESHRHDDIADTCYDSCKIALIDKQLQAVHKSSVTDKISANMAQHFSHKLNVLNAARTKR